MFFEAQPPFSASMVQRFQMRVLFWVGCHDADPDIPGWDEQAYSVFVGFAHQLNMAYMSSPAGFNIYQKFSYGRCLTYVLSTLVLWSLWKIHPIWDLHLLCPLL